MHNIADLITFTTTGDTDLMQELHQARLDYWAQRNNPQNEQIASAFSVRPCTADRRLITFCANILRQNNRLATEAQVLRQCLRLGIAPASQIRQLRRARYLT